MKELLQKIRLTLDITQKDFAKRLGVSERLYCYWEKGERKPGKRSFHRIRKIGLKYLKGGDLKLLQIYEEQLFGPYARLFSEYRFIDVEHLVRDFRKLRDENKYLKAELKAYKKWYSDFKVLVPITTTTKGKKRSVSYA